MKKNIVIVDDHVILAQSLKSMIESREGFTVIKVLSNGLEVIDYFESGNEKPDILLLDINMPKMNGTETMAWLQKNYPEQKVLALSMEDDETTIIKMVKLGVRGYVLKDIKPLEFQLALETISSGDFYYSDSVSEKISKHSIKENVIEELKSKELQFLKLACTEMTYKEIASEMQVSPKTVENYRESLFSKLTVKSRIGLVVYAIKNEIFFL